MAASAKAAGAAAGKAYWVQVGAYRTAEDAESQRAKLSLTGIETKISEREQSGRTVYRVRVGPAAPLGDAVSTSQASSPDTSSNRAAVSACAMSPTKTKPCAPCSVC